MKNNMGATVSRVILYRHSMVVFRHSGGRNMDPEIL